MWCKGKLLVAAAAVLGAALAIWAKRSRVGELDERLDFRATQQAES